MSGHEMICDFPRCDLSRTGCPCSEFSRNVTDKANAWDAISAKNAQISDLHAERERLRGALTDIAEGRGMFGISAENDLEWAMHRAAGAVGLPWRPKTEAQP